MLTTFGFRSAAALLLVTAVTPSLASANGADALYDVHFTPTWSFATHPTAFPPFAHFSPLIGATHNAGVQFWTPGGVSSPGIEVMAESGGTFQLDSEVMQAITAGNAGEVINGGAIFLPGTAMGTFRVTDEFPLVSLVTMIAPSPDWFVGVHDLNLLSPTGWVDNLVVDLFAYDAGTDSGATFTSNDINTLPKQHISLITGGPFTGMDSLGTFTFVRRASTFRYGSVNPAESFVVTSGVPQMGTTVEFEFKDPSGTMLQPSKVFLSAAITADPLYPSGTIVPFYGLTAPGTPGEILVGPTFLTRRAGMWKGNPVGFTLQVPVDPTLEGVPIYLQGFFYDATHRVGLTSAIKLVIGA